MNKVNKLLDKIWKLTSISDVAAEKTEKALIDGIEQFDTTKLKHTETQEKNPLPDKEGKNIHNTQCHEHDVCIYLWVNNFHLIVLYFMFYYCCEYIIRMILLCTLAVLQEKTHQTLLNGVEQFDKATMRHTETAEKVILPNKEGKLKLLRQIRLIATLVIQLTLVAKLYYDNDSCNFFCDWFCETLM